MIDDEPPYDREHMEAKGTPQRTSGPLDGPDYFGEPEDEHRLVHPQGVFQLPPAKQGYPPPPCELCGCVDDHMVDCCPERERRHG